MRKLARKFTCLAIALTGGCDRSDVAQRGTQNVAAERDPCVFITPEGRHLFVGHRSCMRKLPLKHLSGLWLLGFENSRFYEGATTLPSPSDDDMWLDADIKSTLSKRGLKFDGKTHLYRVEFVGTQSNREGYYGHGAGFRRGALVVKMIDLQEIPLRRVAKP